MTFVVGNKIEIRRRALLEAIRFCGGVTAYSECLKVSRTRASNWVNKPEIEMPYEYAVLTEELTQVSIERLSPITEMVNRVIRRLRARERALPVNVEINGILIGIQDYFTWYRADRPILIGTDGVLISGLGQIEKFKSLGLNKIQALILDLEALLLGERSLQETNIDLSISERIAIGLRLETILGDRQGQRSDLKGSYRNGQKNTESCLSLRPKWDEVGRADSYIASLMGFGKGTYHRAKHVCLKGSQDLVDAMDRNEISIAKAEKKISVLKNVQSNRIQVKLEGVQI